MLSLILISCLLQSGRPDGFFLKERVEVTYPGGGVTTFENHLWVGKNRIRTDRLDHNTTIIFDLGLHIVYVIDHNDRTYQISRAAVPKNQTRLSLQGLATIRNGALQRRLSFAEPTGKRKKIASFICDEYRLSYPQEYGMDTRIWTTHHRLLTKAYVRKIWYAAIGTAPPGDVKSVLNAILSDIRGVPIQVVSTIDLEGHQVTTTSTFTHLEPFYDDELKLMAIPSGYQIRRLP